MEVDTEEAVGKRDEATERSPKVAERSTSAEQWNKLATS